MNERRRQPGAQAAEGLATRGTLLRLVKRAARHYDPLVVHGRVVVEATDPRSDHRHPHPAGPDR